MRTTSAPPRASGWLLMRVVGVDAAGTTCFDAPLGHGVDPRVLAYDEGFVVQQPVEARLDESGELRLVLSVRPRQTGDARPRVRRAGRDRGLKVSGQEAPVVRQRLAAYAVVRSARGLLATEYSDLTAVGGRWGMPGGGLDPHEEPADAVLREVVEETGQSVQIGDLVLVQSSHWIGRSPHGPVEDFHAVRLVYRAECAEPTDPVVHDQGGTTASARWVPLDAWPDVSWTQNWRQALRTLMRPPRRTSGGRRPSRTRRPSGTRRRRRAGRQDKTQPDKAQPDKAQPDKAQQG